MVDPVAQLDAILSQVSPHVTARPWQLSHGTGSGRQGHRLRWNLTRFVLNHHGSQHLDFRELGSKAVWRFTALWRWAVFVFNFRVTGCFAHPSRIPWLLEQYRWVYAPCLSYTLIYAASDPSPSPPAFRGASYAHPPLVPSVRLYNDGGDRGGATRPFSHAPSHEECGKCSFHLHVRFLPPTFPAAHPGYNAHLGRSEEPGLHHPIILDQYPSQLPNSTSRGECAPEYHVASGSGNIAQNGFGWRLRPVSELRASKRMHCPFSH